MENEKPRLLIVGGSGYVGSSLCRQFKNEYEVWCTYRRSFTPIPGVKYLPLPDLGERPQCDRLIGQIQPEAVIYSLGSNDETEAEKNPKNANLIHTNGVIELIHFTDLAKSKFIYLSSDLVFSGMEGNFGESDSPLPSTHLGKAKLAAENIVKSRCLNHVIIRCAPLIGRGPIDHPSWIDQIREVITREKKLTLSNRSVRNPVHISFLSTVIRETLKKDLRNKTLHVGGLTRINMRDFAMEFLAKTGFSSDLVDAESSGAKTAPLDFSLNFSTTLELIQAQPLLLKQSLDLLK